MCVCCGLFKTANIKDPENQAKFSKTFSALKFSKEVLLKFCSYKKNNKKKPCMMEINKCTLKRKKNAEMEKAEKAP